MDGDSIMEMKEEFCMCDYCGSEWNTGVLNPLDEDSVDSKGRIAKGKCPECGEICYTKDP